MAVDRRIRFIENISGGILNLGSTAFAIGEKKDVYFDNDIFSGSAPDVYQAINDSDINIFDYNDVQYLGQDRFNILGPLVSFATATPISIALEKFAWNVVVGRFLVGEIARDAIDKGLTDANLAKHIEKFKDTFSNLFQGSVGGARDEINSINPNIASLTQAELDEYIDDCNAMEVT